MKKQAKKIEISKSLGLTTLFILMLLAVSGIAKADPGDIVWWNIQYYNDFETPIGDTIDFSCAALALTADGGCIVAANARSSYVYNRSYLIKLQENGDTLWVRHYGWEYFNYYACAVIVEPDGGFVLAGDKQTAHEIPPPGYPTGAFLIKVDSDGDTVWTGLYNDNPGTYRYNVQDAYRTPDGGYILMGFSLRDATPVTDILFESFLIKVDGDGNEEWTRHYSGPDDSENPDWWWSNLICLSGTPANDGGYALAGGIQMIYADEVYGRWIDDYGMVLKLDANGDTVSTYTYGVHDQILDISATSDDGYIICDLNRDLFSSEPARFCDQFTSLKIDNSNNESWHYDVMFDGSGGGDTGNDTSAVGRAGCELPDNGGYVFTGQRSWGIMQGDDFVHNSQIFIAHFDTEGSLDTLRFYEDEFGDPGMMPITPFDIKIKENGNYLICGMIERVEVQGRVIFPGKGIVAEIEGFTTVSVDDEQAPELPDQISLLQNYPNPFNATSKIQFSLSTTDDVTLAVYDVMGRKVNTLYSGTLAAGTHNITWNGTDESGDVGSSGVYFYRLETSNKTTTKQMLLLK